MKIIRKIIAFIQRFKNRRLISKSNKQLEPVIKKMITDRKRLKADIYVFIHKFFGGRSKYIPPNYKNSEELKVAILDKFQGRMEELNVKYSDLFA